MAFAWDSETVLKVLTDNKQRRTISLCKLHGVEYIGVKKEIERKGEWIVTGGWSEKRSVFTQIVDAVESGVFADAFGTNDPAVLKNIATKPRLAGLIDRDKDGMLVEDSKKLAKKK